MKYPKVLQILTIAAVVTTAAPTAAFQAEASEGRETPAEYEARTEYVLPAGYHYVLEDMYVIIDGNGAALIEADAAPETPAWTEDVQTDAGLAEVQPEAPEETPAPLTEGGEDVSGNPDTAADPNAPADPNAQVDPSIPADPNTPVDPSVPADPNAPVDPSVPADPNAPVDPSVPADPNAPVDPNAPADPSEPADPDAPGESSGDVSGKPSVPAEPAEPAVPVTPLPPVREEKPQEEAPASSLLLAPQTEMDISYLTSEEFKAIRDRIQYNVEVPIEGLPSFITQEMIVGALKAQDETGYPASVTIAQIIQESGFGKYGPGGEDGKGLSYLAYQYCNLFGIKGKGTAGSAVMNTLEMTAAGETYSTQAGFRAYHTYTECIEDRSKLLKEVYSDLTENVTDANTFAMKIGRRWATDLNYGKSLIRTMQRYDLYRLDEMTLVDFSKLIGRFANPCPGSSISSTFGYRTFDHSFHKGLDMGTGTENIPTYAAEAGVVTFAGEAGSAGNLIVIDHGDGLVTKYMHHEEIYVEEGQKVEKGQQIGLSGTTGNSTGNHLHFQVEENGRAVDPVKYLQEENTETVKMREKVEFDTAEIIKNIKTGMNLSK